jgi:pimeloyl-ACP methyl ester carboxylesterase
MTMPQAMTPTSNLPSTCSLATPLPAVLLNVSPGLQRFDLPLLRLLVRDRPITHWTYRQTPDEPCSLEVALGLLVDALQAVNQPVHLIGHGTAGLLGLLCAHRFPQRVQSLTLLAVGANPAHNWQASYYAQLECLWCQRSWVLAQMASALFGRQPLPQLKYYIHLLEQDLLTAPSPHSLVRRIDLAAASVPVPTLVCGGAEDVVVDPVQLQRWDPWLKSGDRRWTCPEGRHFFHHSHAAIVAPEILGFWQGLERWAIASGSSQSAGKRRQYHDQWS